MKRTRLITNDPTDGYLPIGTASPQAPRQLPRLVVIERNSYDEYVAKPEGAHESRWYFTDSREDAILTARAEYGEGVRLSFRKARED